MPRTRVKICCIKSPDEARIAVSLGADAIGLVGKMPSGPGVISDDAITEIASLVPPPIGTFLLTSETTADAIVAHCRRAKTSSVQIVDYVDEREYRKIRAELPWMKLVQVIHIEDESAIARARRLSGFVDALLLDSGSPNGDVKILGGTGKTHNWKISREIVGAVDVPVFLAGGITPGNVREAVETVHPYAVDVCTGVRTNGNLDRLKVEALFRELERTIGG
ncbi:MAG TPA: phosphoribosylanthranilate isomerase [Candidatus Kryptobacter bacterium]|nr:phosphoribosylanthranilate isomerase [Candidatus Kryptobacter bacterium]